MSSPSATRFVVTSDDVRIGYIRIGAGAPVVFASNFRGDVHAFADHAGPHPHLAHRLAALGWEVVLHDGRGMGCSEREITDWSLEGRVRDLEAVIARLGSRPVIVAGADQGAPAAIAYAARNPEHVSRLLLCCPFASGAARYDLPALRLAMSGAASAAPSWELFTNVIAGVVTGFGNAELGRRIAESIQRSMSPEGLSSYLAASRTIDVTNELSLVRAPTLVVHDPAFPFGSFDLCRTVAAGIPDARCVTSDDRFMMGGAFNELLPVIEQFLRGEVRADQWPAEQAHPATLTGREREVLRLLARGHANKSIALALDMSERTVARHITNLYGKIGARTRAAATAYAIRNLLS